MKTLIKLLALILILSSCEKEETSDLVINKPTEPIITLTDSFRVDIHYSRQPYKTYYLHEKDTVIIDNKRGFETEAYILFQKDSTRYFLNSYFKLTLTKSNELDVIGYTKKF